MNLLKYIVTENQLRDIIMILTFKIVCDRTHTVDMFHVIST